MSVKDNENIIKEQKVIEDASNDTKIETNQDYASVIKNGVEVIDVKVVPKIGIPTNSKTWDKIS